MKDHRAHDLPGLVRPGPHVLIVGGGASGVLMAVHLLSHPDRAFRVTIIEGRNVLGCGVAYSTEDADHLLNTRVHNMSAFPDDPVHFHRWLNGQSDGRIFTEQCFVSRTIYGAYLASLLSPWMNSNAERKLRYVQQTCVSLQDTPRGVIAHMQDGQTLIGDIAVLATGHAPADEKNGVIEGAWSRTILPDKNAPIAIIGSGLSMVDQVLSVLKSGHRGPITAVSRRGQLPRAHATSRPITLSIADVPLGAPVSELLRWVRDLSNQAEAQGGTWRDAVDGIRPHVRRIWRAMPHAERNRFLRHAATWWDVHRHRIPPASNVVIAQALSSGQLILQRGAFIRAIPMPHGETQVQFRPHLAQKVQTINAARVIDCRGIRRDPEMNATPLIADLLKRGRARIDPLRIALDVRQDCQLIDCNGQAVPRILAIGPVSRAAFWEITAIPDIREQVFRLADRLANTFAC